jgi:hypothetical protein
MNSDSNPRSDSKNTLKFGFLVAVRCSLCIVFFRVSESKRGLVSGRFDPTRDQNCRLRIMLGVHDNYLGGNLISARTTDLQGRYGVISIKWL